MLRDRKYRRPPLIEVLCDFYFEGDEGHEWDSIRVSEFATAARGRGYPFDKTLHGRGPTSPRGTSRRSKGRRRVRYDYRHSFTSEDGNKTTQVGENLLVVNQLPPYYGWQKFRNESLACLELYKSIWTPTQVVHAGLHYVDIVEVPGEALFIDDYFKLYPVLPEGSEEWSVNNLAMAFEVSGKQPGDVCTIAYHHRPSSSPAVNSFRFRWDYISLDGFALDLAVAEKWLDTAHAFVDRAFRSAFTEECERLFEPED